MIAPHFIKTCGYIISTVSVALLGFVSWQSASKHTALLVCLILGMASSMAGMFLRWLSYVLEEHRGR